MLSALAAISVLGLSPALAESGRPEMHEGSDMMEGAEPMAHPGGMGYPGMMGGEGRRAWACAGAGSRVEGRLAYARAELRITPAQESLWQAYATALREAERTLAGQCKDKPEADSSLPDRLDRHVETMAARLEAMRATNRALRPLYAALDAGQKKAADDIMGMAMMAPGRRR
jgi:hypothetical protein